MLFYSFPLDAESLVASEVVETKHNSKKPKHVANVRDIRGIAIDCRPVSKGPD
jgi:hypothetical protein